MFEIFSGVNELVLVFCENKLTFINEKGQIYYKSYSHVLEGRDISEFISRESLSDMRLRLKAEEDFNCRIKLADGDERPFRISFLKGPDGRKCVMLSEEERIFFSTPDKALREDAPKTLYDPLRMGKADIYIHDIESVAESGYSYIEELKESVIIKKNRELSGCVQRIAESFDKVISKSRYYIREINSPEGKRLVVKNVFSFSELMENIIKKTNNYIALENLKITLNYTTRFDDLIISANYSNIMSVVTGLIHNSISYVIASGRKGRIDVSLTSEGEGVKLVITDNGIGLSDETIGFINNEEYDVSKLSGERKKEFLNLRVIRSYVETNNGELSLIHIKEKGSTAVLKLPALLKTLNSFMEEGAGGYEIRDEITEILKQGIIHI